MRAYVFLIQKSELLLRFKKSTSMTMFSDCFGIFSERLFCRTLIKKWFLRAIFKMESKTWKSTLKFLIVFLIFAMNRSNPPGWFLEKDVLKIRSKFTGKQPSRRVKSHFGMGILLRICCIFNRTPRTPFLENTSEGLLLNVFN